MKKSYLYSILITIIIPLFSKIQLNIYKQSEIKLVIKGKGNQQILHNDFSIDPSEVLVNGNLKKSCKKTCNLDNDDKNDVILKFQNQINTCYNMFRGLNNLIEVDLSNFDASKVVNMETMFYECKAKKSRIW